MFVWKTFFRFLGRGNDFTFELVLFISLFLFFSCVFFFFFFVVFVVLFCSYNQGIYAIAHLILCLTT